MALIARAAGCFTYFWAKLFILFYGERRLKKTSAQDAAINRDFLRQRFYRLLSFSARRSIPLLKRGERDRLRRRIGMRHDLGREKGVSCSAII